MFLIVTTQDILSTISMPLVIMIELGGNIKLVGFRDVEPAKLIVVKKVVGNYARKFAEQITSFEELLVDLKELKDGADNLTYAVIGQIIVDGKEITSEVIHGNLFFGLDQTLSKLFTNVTAVPVDEQ